MPGSGRARAVFPVARLGFRSEFLGVLPTALSTAITGGTLTVGPFTPGIVLTVRTRVANSNPGTVTGTPQQVVVG